VAKYGNTILVRELVDGIASLRKDKWKPTLYLIDRSDEETGLTSLYGDKVRAIQPGTMSECRDFVKQYSDVSDFSIFGQLNETLQYMNEYDLHEPNFGQLKILSIDIETGSAPGQYTFGDNHVVKIRKLS
jgi:hypothetical protein